MEATERLQQCCVLPPTVTTTKQPVIGKEVSSFTELCLSKQVLHQQKSSRSFTCFREQWCALLLALTRATQFIRLLSSFTAFHKNSLKIHHVQDLLLLTTFCTACKVSSQCSSIFSLFPSLIWIKAPFYTAVLMLTSQPTQKSLVYSRDQTFLIYLIISPEQRLISSSLEILHSLCKMCSVPLV